MKMQKIRLKKFIHIPKIKKKKKISAALTTTDTDCTVLRSSLMDATRTTSKGKESRSGHHIEVTRSWSLNIHNKNRPKTFEMGTQAEEMI